MLFGDAGHAMTPDLGQGACQAIEDATKLGAVFFSPTIANAMVYFTGSLDGNL